MLVSIMNLLMLDGGVVPPPTPPSPFFDEGVLGGGSYHDEYKEKIEYERKKRLERIKKDEDDFMMIMKTYLENRN